MSKFILLIFLTTKIEKKNQVMWDWIQVM